MAISKVILCGCMNSNHSQDDIYGKGKRLHNPAFKKGAKPDNYKCTVCGKERNIK